MESSLIRAMLLFSTLAVLYHHPPAVTALKTGPSETSLQTEINGGCESSLLTLLRKYLLGADCKQHPLVLKPDFKASLFKETMQKKPPLRKPGAQKKLETLVDKAAGDVFVERIVDANLDVDINQPLSETAEEFVCVTMDWWPQERCDYGVCSWGNTSVLSQDLSSPLLRNALKALSPVLRIGGSLQDHIVYNTSAVVPCHRMAWNESEMFRCRDGCLTMKRWDEFYAFANSNGAQLVFGLNGLFGRNRTGWYTYEGDWNPSNARGFLEYSIRAGYDLLGVELGNELGGATGIAAKLSPGQYARDMRTLRTLVDDVYAEGSPSQAACRNRTGRVGPLCVRKPLVIAPDNIDFDAAWYQEFVRELGNETLVLDGLSHHLYSMGPGVDPRVDSRMLNPAYHDGVGALFARARAVRARARAGTQLWLGEAGGAFNSGRPNASDAFLSGFWWLHEMGSTARFGYDVYCRQTLIGGNYGLLRKDARAPAPDLWAAILWKRLMGRKVLQANVTDAAARDVRAFAQCLKGDPTGGVALVLINYSNDTTYRLAHDLGNAGNFSDVLIQVTDAVRLEYHFTAGGGGNMHSKVSVLNGVELRPFENGTLPELTARIVPDKQERLRLAPLSYAFVELRGVNATSCRG